MLLLLGTFQVLVSLTRQVQATAAGSQPLSSAFSWELISKLIATVAATIGIVAAVTKWGKNRRARLLESLRIEIRMNGPGAREFLDTIVGAFGDHEDLAQKLGSKLLQRHMEQQLTIFTRARLSPEVESRSWPASGDNEVPPRETR